MSEYETNTAYEAPQEAPHSEIISSVVDEMGVIAANTKITGNITTKGHLAVSGTVIGDISAKGNVFVTGTVKGKITCSNLMLEGCNVMSEIETSEAVIIKENVHAVGRITCKDITVMSSLNGDILASGKVGISKDAVIRGNITAASLGVEAGAKIEGMMSIK
ncbi:MAG: polymer-forming cytoskeletal protein [Firmicutes bacterium]|nr:polymer-forming cytoskeletal protein [Bacillota bacterium]